MRKEEIEKASICQYQIIGTIGEQEAFKNGFTKGAEWADKTMIEKACEVLDEMTEGRLGKIFLNEFRKHLEE